MIKGGAGWGLYMKEKVYHRQNLAAWRYQQLGNLLIGRGYFIGPFYRKSPYLPQYTSPHCVWTRTSTEQMGGVADR